MTAMPQQKPRRSRWGIALISIGLVLGVGGLLVGIILAIIGFASATGGKDVFENGRGSVSMEAGDEVQFYRHPDSRIHCDIQPPAGGRVDSVEGQKSTVNDWESFATIRATVGGEYTFQCTAPVMVGSPVSAGGIVAGIGGVGLALISMALGVVLLIIGIVLVIRARKGGGGTPSVPYASPSPIAPDAPSRPATPYRPGVPQQNQPQQGKPQQWQQPPAAPGQQGQQPPAAPGQQGWQQPPNGPQGPQGPFGG